MVLRKEALRCLSFRESVVPEPGGSGYSGEYCGSRARGFASDSEIEDVVSSGRGIISHG